MTTELPHIVERTRSALRVVWEVLCGHNSYMRVAAAFLCTVLLSSTGLVFAEVDSQCPGTALERGPVPISGMDEFKRVIREQGYSGRVRFRATITEEGSVRDVAVAFPASMKDTKAVRKSIEGMKFCPAVRYSRYATLTMDFDIEVR